MTDMSSAGSDTGGPGAPARPRPKGRGNALGFWFFRMALRITGLRGAYGLLYFVCAYYVLFDRAAVAAADAYVRHRFPGRSWGWRRGAAYRLFIQQGKCLIDRHAHNVGHTRFSFSQDNFTEICRQFGPLANGLVVLLSHTGGWQLALPHLRLLTGEKPVSLLMNAAETPDVQAHVRGDDAGFHVISPEAGPACVVEMVARLQKGEIVSIMGDRAYGGQTVDVSFLGNSARFPASAFAVARAAQSPVLALFVAKTGVASYAMEAKLFEAPSHDDRQSIRKGVGLFAEALESFVRRHPYQCFLFDDIWGKSEA